MYLRPGPITFATLFALDSMARASLAAVITLHAYVILGSERDVSILFTSVLWGGIVASLFVPALVRRFRPRWTYTMATVLLIAAPLLMASGIFELFGLGMLMRAIAAACLLNLINLYIMAYIKKRDLARSEPIRTFFSFVPWCIGPSLGWYIYENVSPAAIFGFSAACAVLLLIYFWWLRLEYGPALAPDEPKSINPFPHIRRFVQQPRLMLAWLLNFGREVWWVTLFVYGPIYMVEHGASKQQGSYLLSACTSLLLFTLGAGWLARKAGLRRHMIAWMLLCGGFTLAVGLINPTSPWVVAALLVFAAMGAVSVDAVCMVPYMRAVRQRERPEMGMVFSLYRDFASFAAPAAYSLLLTFFDLSAVFVVSGLILFACAWLARWIPRGM